MTVQLGAGRKDTRTVRLIFSSEDTWRLASQFEKWANEVQSNGKKQISYKGVRVDKLVMPTTKAGSLSSRERIGTVKGQIYSSREGPQYMQTFIQHRRGGRPNISRQSLACQCLTFPLVYHAGLLTNETQRVAIVPIAERARGLHNRWVTSSVPHHKDRYEAQKICIKALFKSDISRSFRPQR
jgi:hypothetical protein